MGRSVAVNPTCEFIAVGMNDGSLRVYSTKTWKMTYRKKVSKEWIEDLKFSPDGAFLAVGSHDNKVYVYNMPGMTPFKKIGKSSSFITHIDWSQDSQAFRTNDGSYEILYYNVSTGQQNTGGATAHRDEEWNTQSCTLGWAMQGVWEPGQDGSDINHADRSNEPVVDGMQLLATADDNGKVNVFRYPCMVENSTPIKCVGHSSHVTKVRFDAKDTHLFSIGGNDTTVMQWKIIV